MADQWKNFDFDDTVVSCTERENGEVVGSTVDDNMIGYDPETDTNEWETEVSDTRGITETDNNYIARTTDNGVVAYNPETDTNEWEHELHDGIVKDVITARDGLIVSIADELVGYDPEAGEAEFINTDYEGNAVEELEEGVVIIGSDPVTAYDYNNDSVVWQFEVFSAQSAESVDEQDGILVASADNGKVAAVNTETGEKEWEHELHDADIVRTVIVSGNEVISGSTDRNVISYDIDGRGQWWRHQLHTDSVRDVIELSNGHIVSGGGRVVGFTNGSMYSYDNIEPPGTETNDDDDGDGDGDGDGEIIDARESDILIVNGEAVLLDDSS